jgi:predicted DCC family thiol-disulfide oxidoreductase YuxK
MYETPMPMPQLTVWYNTRCPVCEAGIGWQRNKLVALVRSGRVAFEDINDQPQALAAHGVDVDDVRRRLHATDEEGRLVTGADVALALWQLTPGEAWLATVLGNRVTRPLTRFGYDRFADLLFAWNRRKGRW